MTDLTTLGGRIRTLRVAAGLTQAQLAAALGVGRIAVNRWERGRRSPSMPSLVALSIALDVTMDQLAGPMV